MKSIMSGQDIPLIHRLSSAWKIFKAYRSGIYGNADTEIKFHDEITEVFNKYVKVPVNGARILEIGCGRTATQTALFKADGAAVTGIDVEVPTYKLNLTDFISVIKMNGVERAIKSLFRHLLFDKRFFSDLASQYSKPISFESLDVRIMDATSLEFADNCFDFVYSAWAFEHIDNVPAAISEINRVLNTVGVAYIAIHLFPSLSGGHHEDWIFPDRSPSSRVPPWDHCLDNKYPVNTYLNRLCLKDYRDIFYRHINIFDEVLSFEGEKYLIPEKEAILFKKGYTRDDLLTRTVVFLCNKKDTDIE